MNDQRESAKERRDLFTLEIMRNNLVATVREMVDTTIRTAYSSTFAEGRDFSCSIFDAAGRMVAQDLGLAVHLGALERPVQAILASGLSLEQGDVLILNEPYLGTHHADCIVARPLIAEGRLYGLVVNIGHWTDIGGMAAGGCAGTATHVVQEGLIIPLCKLYSRGELQLPVRDFILSNVRIKEDIWGDLQAQVASTHTAERRMLVLIEKYGLGAVLDAMDNSIAYTQKRFAAALAAFPSGTFRAEDVMEDDGLTTMAFPIRVAVERRGNKLVIDFAGTAAQALGPINCSFSVTCAAAYAASVALLDPTLPVNSGCFDSIDVVAEEGSLVRPVWPAPVFGSTFDLSVRIFETIFRAVAEAVPDRAIAGSFSSGANITGSGYRLETGEEFLWYHFGEGGLGARAAGDGNSGVWHLMGNARNQPAEVWEHRYPVRVESLRLVPDSAGAGRFRGGFGVERRFRLLENTFVSGLADRHRIAPWGLAGGSDGTCNRWSVIRQGREVELHELFELPSRGKFFNLPLEAGDVLVLRQGGGGGYGDPALREATRLAQDIENGLISEAAARRLYGSRASEEPVGRVQHGGARRSAQKPTIRVENP